ncbi:MAG: archease [Gammaproteobacteria bacterium]
MSDPSGASDSAGGSWEHFSHDADMGVHGTGSSMAAAFEQAALALTAVVTDPVKVRSSATLCVRCEEPDPEMLFFDWLNAVIYEMATREMLFGRFHVEVENGVLTAGLRGEIVDRLRHAPAVEVKGATLTELDVHQDSAGVWHASCVLDV